MKAKPMYAPQICHFHNQTFTVQIEGDTYRLVVLNADKTWKQLGVEKKVEAAPQVPNRWPFVQTKWVCKVSEHTTLRAFDLKKLKALPTREEKRRLMLNISDWILGEELLKLFPQNRHVQYAD